MDPQQNAMDAFLAGRVFAVAGASRDRAKYGNRVLRVLRQRGFEVIPVNPNATSIEGLPCVASLLDIKRDVHGCAIITHPEVTEQIVTDAIAVGVRHLWMQPGAESELAVEQAEQAGIAVVHGGPCLLVVLGYRGD